jgi:hypothetical protein
MKAKHPKVVRRMKKIGRWEQDQIDGWAKEALVL